MLMTPNALNYHHLLYFWAVAKEGSLRRASELLHVSQPSISAQLKPIFYSERHSFLGRSSPGAAWRAIEVLLSQKCSAISLA